MAEEEEGSKSSSALQVVLVVYGGVFVVLLFFFSLVRTRFPRVYNPRNTFAYLNCELATRKFGFFSWIPGVMGIKDEEIFEQCGMDAICFVRMLRFGLKVSGVACCNAIWLMPTYRTSPDHPSTLEVTDSLDKLTIANVHEGSNRLFATVVSSYILFGCTILLLKREFAWYIRERHLFMQRESPENYTVVISGIPPALRSKTALGEYLGAIFQSNILQIDFAISASDVEALAAKREALLFKLEHAKAVLELTGSRPLHLNRYAQRVDSVAVYSQLELQLAQRINARVGELVRAFEEHEDKVRARLADPWRQTQGGGEDFENDLIPPAPPAFVLDAAFIVFSSLQSAVNARQILHHRLPFRLVANDAPSPADVFWKNVGLPHQRVQITSVVAGVLTALLCLLWTVPVSAIATFTKVESLKLRLPFLAEVSARFPLFDDLLALVSPVALITLVSILPLILHLFAQLEGHLGEDALQASLFSKLATFMIVQVFLVSSIAGTIYDQVDTLLSQPTTVATILGTSLPGQAVIFINFTFVKSTLNLTLELLRVVPLLFALVRSCVAYNLTEKERDTAVLSLPPLTQPGPLDLTFPLAHTILMYVVLFVYAVLAPVSSFVLLFAFFAWEIAYKHQLAFVYDPRKDTGGKIWPMFAGYVVICMLIAQVTILGVIGLKEGVNSAPFMFPLIVVTALFWRYLSQQHFRVADMLPMRDAYLADRAAQRRGIDMAFALNQYRQKHLIPIQHPELDADQGSRLDSPRQLKGKDRDEAGTPLPEEAEKEPHSPPPRPPPPPVPSRLDYPSPPRPAMLEVAVEQAAAGCGELDLSREQRTALLWHGGDQMRGGNQQDGRGPYRLHEMGGAASWAEEGQRHERRDGGRQEREDESDEEWMAEDGSALAAAVHESFMVGQQGDVPTDLGAAVHDSFRVGSRSKGGEQREQQHPYSVVLLESIRRAGTRGRTDGTTEEKEALTLDGRPFAGQQGEGLQSETESAPANRV